MIDSSGDLKHLKADWPFYWISQINSAYADALERRIKPIGIDVPRWRALISLYEDQHLSVSEIAEFSAQKLNTTTKVIQRMIKDELVVTRVRPSDGRVTEVCLTEKGDQLRRAALEEARVIYEQSFGTIAPERLAEMNRLLAEVHKALKKL